MKVTLIIPTLNEIEGIKVFLPMIKKDWVDQLIILDGGSRDGTLEYAKKCGYFVYIQKKPGLHNAYTEILPYIEGEAVITFSPDGNCIPELIPSLVVKIREGYDMVIVSRYLNGAKSYDDTILTAFGNWFFTRTINLLYRAKYTDAMGIYRAYKTKIIYELKLNKDDAYITVEKLFWTRVSWEPLLSVRAAKRRLKIAEIPGNEPRRCGGNRKLHIIKWGMAYYLQFILELFFWR